MAQFFEGVPATSPTPSLRVPQTDNGHRRTRSQPGFRTLGSQGRPIRVPQTRRVSSATQNSASDEVASDNQYAKLVSKHRQN
jgi:hypothetical protein